MPTVPVRVYSRQVELRPAPTPQRQNLPTPQIEAPPAVQPKPAEASGGALFRAGSQIGLQLYSLAQARADLAVQTKAEKDLLGWMTDYTRNPQTGVFNKDRGESAIGLTPRAAEELEKVYGEISGRLNDRQRTAFQQAAGRHIQNFHEDVLGYESKETEAFYETNHQALMNLELAHALERAADPIRLGDSLKAIEAENFRYAGSRGLGKVWLEDQNKKTRSALWSAVIDRLLVDDKPALASAYFEEYGNEILTAEQRDRIAAKVKTAKTDSLAAQVNQDIWAELGPKTDQDPASVDAMVDRARSQYAEKNPEVFDAVKKSIVERANIWNASVKNRADAREATVWRSILAGAGYEQIRTMPDFINIPGDRQVAIKKELETHARDLIMMARGDEEYLWVRSQRARTLQEQAEEDKTRSAYGAFLDLSKTAKLSQLGEDEITNLLPQLGFSLTNQLLEKKKSLKTEGNRINATINDAIFDEIANEAGLRPYAKPTERTETENARLGQLKSRALTEIDRVQGGKRELSEQEQRDLMHRIIDPKVLLSIGTEVPAATLLPGESITGPVVPFAEIPGPFVDEAINYMRSIGSLPQGLSRAGAIQQYKNVLERAYGLRKNGGTRADIDALLRNQSDLSRRP